MEFIDKNLKTSTTNLINMVICKGKHKLDEEKNGKFQKSQIKLLEVKNAIPGKTTELEDNAIETNQHETQRENDTEKNGTKS